MHRSSLLLALPLAAACVGPKTATAPSVQHQDGPPTGACWKTNPIPVVFNPSLDPALEIPVVVGQATSPKDRETAFANAVAAWNAALVANGVAVAFAPVVTDVTAFTTLQSQQVCSDAISGAPVFDTAYQAKAAPFGGASTAQSPNNAAGPGYNQGGSVVTYDVDRRLAETDPLDNHPEVAAIQWFTHFPPTAGASCDQIPWMYIDGGAAPPNPYFDYYSVMLHELGHLLGLGHRSDPARQNVMRAQLWPGQRAEIGPLEVADLQTLYASCAGGAAATN
jgi:hypothetical protein